MNKPPFRNGIRPERSGGGAGSFGDGSVQCRSEEQRKNDSMTMKSASPTACSHRMPDQETHDRRSSHPFALEEREEEHSRRMQQGQFCARLVGSNECRTRQPIDQAFEGTEKAPRQRFATEDVDPSCVSRERIAVRRRRPRARTVSAVAVADDRTTIGYECGDVRDPQATRLPPTGRVPRRDRDTVSLVLAYDEQPECVWCPRSQSPRQPRDQVTQADVGQGRQREDAKGPVSGE